MKTKIRIVVPLPEGFDSNKSNLKFIAKHRESIYNVIEETINEYESNVARRVEGQKNPVTINMEASFKDIDTMQASDLINDIKTIGGFAHIIERDPLEYSLNPEE